jgi:hypothetical protein
MYGKMTMLLIINNKHAVPVPTQLDRMALGACNLRKYMTLYS